MVGLLGIVIVEVVWGVFWGAWVEDQGFGFGNHGMWVWEDGIWVGNAGVWVGMM